MNNPRTPSFPTLNINPSRFISAAPAKLTRPSAMTASDAMTCAATGRLPGGRYGSE